MRGPDLSDLEDQLDELEEVFGIGPTKSVVVTGDADGWPEDVEREDITVWRQEPGHDEDTPLEVEKLLIPLHRPPEFRGGIVTMTCAEVAQVYAAMPPDIREKERELRAERGLEIPQVLHP